MRGGDMYAGFQSAAANGIILPVEERLGDTAANGGEQRKNSAGICRKSDQ